MRKRGCFACARQPKSIAPASFDLQALSRNEVSRLTPGTPQWRKRRLPQRSSPASTRWRRVLCSTRIVPWRSIEGYELNVSDSRSGRSHAAAGGAETAASSSATTIVCLPHPTRPAYRAVHSPLASPPRGRVDRRHEPLRPQPLCSDGCREAERLAAAQQL